MAGEIQFVDTTGRVCYCQVRNTSGLIWNTQTSAFESYLTANIAHYAIAAVEEGSASGYYIATMPAIPAATYNIIGKEQVGGGPAESDPTVSSGFIDWNGAIPVGAANVVLAGGANIQRNLPFNNFEFIMISSVDHVSLLPGLTVSGQVSLDGAAYVATTNAPVGVSGGTYKINFAAADLNAGTCTFQFTATGADATVITIITQP